MLNERINYKHHQENRFWESFFLGTLNHLLPRPSDNVCVYLWQPKRGVCVYACQEILMGEKNFVAWTSKRETAVDAFSKILFYFHRVRVEKNKKREFATQFFCWYNFQDKGRNKDWCNNDPRVCNFTMCLLFNLRRQSSSLGKLSLINLKSLRDSA